MNFMKSLFNRTFHRVQRTPTTGTSTTRASIRNPLESRSPIEGTGSMTQGNAHPNASNSAQPVPSFVQPAPRALLTVAPGGSPPSSSSDTLSDLSLNILTETSHDKQQDILNTFLETNPGVDVSSVLGLFPDPDSPREPSQQTPPSRSSVAEELGGSVQVSSSADAQLVDLISNILEKTTDAEKQSVLDNFVMTNPGVDVDELRNMFPSLFHSELSQQTPPSRSSGAEEPGGSPQVPSSDLLQDLINNILEKEKTPASQQLVLNTFLKTNPGVDVARVEVMFPSLFPSKLSHTTSPASRLGARIASSASSTPVAALSAENFPITIGELKTLTRGNPESLHRTLAAIKLSLIKTHLKAEGQGYIDKKMSLLRECVQAKGIDERGFTAGLEILLYTSKVCSAANLEIVPIEPDGNCLYNALIEGLDLTTLIEGLDLTIKGLDSNMAVFKAGLTASIASASIDAEVSVDIKNAGYTKESILRIINQDNGWNSDDGGGDIIPSIAAKYLVRVTGRPVTIIATEAKYSEPYFPAESTDAKPIVIVNTGSHYVATRGGTVRGTYL